MSNFRDHSGVCRAGLGAGSLHPGTCSGPGKRRWCWGRFGDEGVTQGHGVKMAPLGLAGFEGKGKLRMNPCFPPEHLGVLCP